MSKIVRTNNGYVEEFSFEEYLINRFGKEKGSLMIIEGQKRLRKEGIEKITMKEFLGWFKN